MTRPLIASNAEVRQGWEAVDAVLDDLERLAASELEEDRFYSQLVERLASLGCSAAIVWSVGSDGSPRVAWRGSARKDGNGSVAEPPREEVRAAIVAETATLLDGQSPGAAAQDQKVSRCIIAPWKALDRQQGALQVWLNEGIRQAAKEGYLRLMSAVAEVVATFVARQQERTVGMKLGRQARIDAFNQSLHESLELDETAYRIVNDGRALVGCDRLAVAVRRGGRYRVVAVSGAEHVHRRSESVRQLERLCDRVAWSGQALWQGGEYVRGQETRAQQRPHPGPLPEGEGEDVAPQVSEALAEYLDVSPALWLAAIPLTESPAENAAGAHAVGVLVFEQYNEPHGPAVRELIESIVGHCRLALTNALSLDAVPGHRFWMAVGREGRLARWTSRTSVGLIALALIVLALVAIPAEVRVKARGELQPVVKNEVFAPRDGMVTAVHVDHGEHVQAGDKLLEMRSPDLELEMQRVQGELETTRKRLAAAAAERLQTRPADADVRLRQRRLTAEEEQLQEQVRSLEQREEMLQRQIEELTMRSPVEGDVITWNAQQRLAARPLRRGDALFTIADPDGAWQLELRVPSRRAGRLIAAGRDGSAKRDVSFVLTGTPGVKLQGTVTQVAQRVEIDESGESYVVATVETPHERLPHRVPGATVVAHIACGRGSLGEAWFGELLDAARLWMPVW